MKRTQADLELKGKMAMQIISDYPLYASTCGITYDQAIEIAKVLVPMDQWHSYLAEFE